MLELSPSDPFAAVDGVHPDERPAIDILLAAPRGFCAGDRRAIAAVRDALVLHGPPVYVRRPIVHNLAVMRELEAEGAVVAGERFSSNANRLAEVASARCPSVQLVGNANGSIGRVFRSAGRSALLRPHRHPKPSCRAYLAPC